MLTEFSNQFLELLDIEGRDAYELTPEAEVLHNRDFNDLEIEFVSNLKVRRTVPKVEVSYFSNSKVEDAYGDMLTVEDGNVKWGKGIPGYQYPTDGVVFRHNIEELKSKLGTNESKRLATSAYSAGYGFRSIIARNLGVESLDIQCAVDLSQRNVRLIVYDNEVSGSGLSHAAYQDLDSFLLDTRNSLETCICSGFCEKCLLLPRTPTHIVERGLLNRFDGLEFLT